MSRLCGKEVTPQAVSQWQERRIPPGWLSFLKTIRPDVFEEQRAKTKPYTGPDRRKAKAS